MSDKVFKTIDEQIEILRSRGLSIGDDQTARVFLLHNNYYRVSGYSLTLRNHDVFYKTASFQNIIDIYSFDHELRHILLKYIDTIEVSFKSVYAYRFTERHGGTGYLDPQYFTNKQKHLDILTKADEQLNTRLPHEAYLKHFVNDLQQDVPLWAYVDLLTIADISFLYSITESAVRKSVALDFKLPMATGDAILGQFMKSMTIIRNLCAHESRLFNRLFEQKPTLSKAEKMLLNCEADGNLDNAHLYGFVINMRRLLSVDDFAKMKIELISLTRKYPFVNLKYYGFKADWTTAL